MTLLTATGLRSQQGLLALQGLKSRTGLLVGGGPVVPSNAILQRDGSPILDRAGNYILTR